MIKLCFSIRLNEDRAPTFPEVNSLKDISRYDSICFSCSQELWDLLHLLEGHLCLWNLLDGLLPFGVQAVDKPTENLGWKKEQTAGILILAQIRIIPCQIQQIHFFNKGVNSNWKDIWKTRHTFNVLLSWNVPKCGSLFKPSAPHRLFKSERAGLFGLNNLISFYSESRPATHCAVH